MNLFIFAAAFKLLISNFRLELIYQVNIKRVNSLQEKGFGSSIPINSKSMRVR